MSDAAIPAAFSAATTFAIAAEFTASARVAVRACETTPNVNVARSGVTVALPTPTTVIVRPVESEPTAVAFGGSPTPANTARRTSAASAASRGAMRVPAPIARLYAAVGGNVTQAAAPPAVERWR